MSADAPRRWGLRSLVLSSEVARESHAHLVVARKPLKLRSRRLSRVDAPRTRRTFARLESTIDVPNLIDIQRRSFERLVDPVKGGLRETIDDVSPIEDYTGNLAIQFGELAFEEPVATIEECREKDITFANRSNRRMDDFQINFLTLNLLQGADDGLS